MLPKDRSSNKTKRYTRVSMFLHWSVAFVIAVNIALVWIVVSCLTVSFDR